MPYTFTQRVDNAFSYFVTVLERPPGDPQYDPKSCYSDNWSGTVAGADVSNVDITCGYFVQ